jgi:hypothetical protein
MDKKVRIITPGLNSILFEQNCETCEQYLRVITGSYLKGQAGGELSPTATGQGHGPCQDRQL